uniref:cDNA FLJ26218 fis, clone ADG08191 n=1 Tax=Homo sapiens TaxID=9606 RepID=Q6ZP90_HUMAN|nr:unnamed protein product [Homo sapiens]
MECLRVEEASKGRWWLNQLGSCGMGRSGQQGLFRGIPAKGAEGCGSDSCGAGGTRAHSPRHEGQAERALWPCRGISGWRGGLWLPLGQKRSQPGGQPTAAHPRPTGRSFMRQIWSCRGSGSTLRSWSHPLTAAQPGGSRSCSITCRRRTRTCGPWRSDTAATWTRPAW